MRRKYYSARTGKNLDAVRYELPLLCKLFYIIYADFSQEGYFQEYFGYACIDGDVEGKLGSDIELKMFLAIKKPNLWPIKDSYENYSEDDLFDVIEFLWDHVSKPLKGYFHGYYNCGQHYETFDKESGQQEFRAKMNEMLMDYKEGYELSENGEILVLPQQGLDTLLNANIPPCDPDNIESRMQAATLKFRRSRSSLEDRRDAIRDLADVLEFLRPQLKTIISKQDDKDLFQIANQFGIRHHNDQQKQGYDKAIWYSWIFYYYLATIHACIRLLQKESENLPEG